MADFKPLCNRSTTDEFAPFMWVLCIAFSIVFGCFSPLISIFLKFRREPFGRSYILTFSLSSVRVELWFPPTRQEGGFFRRFFSFGSGSDDEFTNDSSTASLHHRRHVARDKQIHQSSAPSLQAEPGQNSGDSLLVALDLFSLY